MTENGDENVNCETDLVFADEVEDRMAPDRNPWKVMIVDDEVEVHDVTHLALQDVVFEGEQIIFINAYSAAEAKDKIREDPDIAFILLDVVMETDQAGLDVIRYIREELGNHIVRIVLRTGQPGSAPEKEVIIDYDISDYKEKAELTSNKLFTTIVSSLRAYRQLSAIVNGRRGLEKIIAASPSIYKLESIEKFISGVFAQLMSFIHISENSFYANTTANPMFYSDNDLKLIAGTGLYKKSADLCVVDHVPNDVMKTIREAATLRISLYFENHCIIYFHAENIGDNLFYIEPIRVLDKWDIDLLELFCRNVSIAYENAISAQNSVK